MNWFDICIVIVAASIWLMLLVGAIYLSSECFVFGALCVIIVVAGGAAIITYKPGPTFTLSRADWTCVKSHQVESTAYVKSGSVMVPITSTSEECDNYVRR